MRLIDADALLDFLGVGHLRPPTEICFSELMMKNIIELMPTVDAVPVIRCKDCKHYKKEIKCVGGHYSGCDWWLDEGCESPVDEDGYCSYAKRREK